MVRVLLIGLLLVTALLWRSGSLLSADRENNITIEQPWARASILKSRPGAAYLTIRNNGTAPDRLLRATSPRAETVMIHASEMSGGNMRMRGMPSVEIGAKASIAFEPGGMHLMIMGLQEPLRRGELLPMVLEFERAGPVSIEMPVLSPGAKGSSDD